MKVKGNNLQDIQTPWQNRGKTNGVQVAFRKDLLLWQQPQKFAPLSINRDKVTQTTKDNFLKDLKLYNFHPFILR